MNRRDVMANGARIGAALVLVKQAGLTETWASATPEATVSIPACDQDLESADFSATLVIPETVDEAELDGVEQRLLGRVHALGWSSCSLDRLDRDLVLNARFPESVDVPDPAELMLLLSEPGRIDLVDGGAGSIAIGDRIVTTPLAPDGPEINVVYTTIVSNGDFTSVAIETSTYGQEVVRFEVVASGAERLAEFTGANAGSNMPLVVDGIVVANPVVQAELSDAFELQGLDSAWTTRIVVYASGLPYPERLYVARYEDVRATPEA